MLHRNRSAHEAVQAGRRHSAGLWQGVLTVAIVTALAMGVGAHWPMLGSALSGIVLGLLMRNVLGIGAQFQPVATFCTKHLLRVAIVLLGSTLTLYQALMVGQKYLVVILATVTLTLAASYLAGRWLRVPPALAGLIGAGTAICGATAIVTVSSIVRAREEEMTYALSTIFFFNLVAMLVYPLVGHLAGMEEATFGAWAGTAIHDTSSVLAAAFAYADEAGKVATVVKLTRTLLLIPLVVGFSLAFAGRSQQTGGVMRGVGAAFPWFVVGFMGMSVLSSVGVISPELSAFLGRVSKSLVTVVLVAVGLSSDLGRVRRLGLRPLLIGLMTSVVVAMTSYWLLTGVLS